MSQDRAGTLKSDSVNSIMKLSAAVQGNLVLSSLNQVLPGHWNTDVSQGMIASDRRLPAARH